MKLSNVLWCCAIVVASSGFGISAQAAPEGHVNWTGFYLGVQGGAAWSNFSITEQASFGSSSRTAATSSTDSAGEFGVYGGLRFQTSQGFIFGGEADYNWTRLSTVTDAFELASGPSGTCASQGTSTQMCIGPATSKLNWYGTVRGVVGASAGPWMLYATGGFAYGEVENSVAGTLKVNTVVIPSFDVRDSAVRHGWTVGLGAELAVNEWVSLRLQWNHVDLGGRTLFAASGTVSPDGGRTVSPYSVSVKDEVVFNTIRAGLTVRFSPTAPLLR